MTTERAPLPGFPRDAFERRKRRARGVKILPVFVYAQCFICLYRHADSSCLCLMSFQNLSSTGNRAGCCCTLANILYVTFFFSTNPVFKHFIRTVPYVSDMNLTEM